jgi:ribosomal protein S18 acetylase RimI-like enzyme
MVLLSSAEVWTMQRKDVNLVVEIHIAAFQNFFLTFLGPAFLRTLYRGILQDDDGIAFVCLQNKGIKGFVAGTSDPSGFYRRLLYSHWWQFGFASIIPILKQPSILFRLLRALNPPHQFKETEKEGLLMSIAVSPMSQGMGIGKVLIDAFLAEASNRQLKRVRLTTDRESNEFVNEFYRKMGFEIRRCFVTPENRKMNEYVIEL